MSGIRLLIVDPDEGYWNFAEPEFLNDRRIERAARFDSCDQALGSLESVKPSVAIIDTSMVGPAATELMERLSTGLIPVPVVAMSSSLDDDSVGNALAIGAMACLSHSAPARHVRAVVMEVAAGRLPIQRDLAERPDLLTRVISEYQRKIWRLGPVRAEACPLTERELTILDLVAGGQANKQIANQLEISERTVKNHMTNILAKLSARDRAHAVRIGIQSGWICRDQWQGEERRAEHIEMDLQAAA